MAGRTSIDLIVKWLLPIVLLVTFTLQLIFKFPTEGVLELSNLPTTFLQNPWTIITYSFLHSSLLHFSINFVLLILILLANQMSCQEEWGVFFIAVVLSGLLFVMLPSESEASIVGASAGIAALFSLSLCRLVSSNRVGLIILFAVVLVDFLTQGWGFTLGLAMHLTGYLVGLGYYFLSSIKAKNREDILEDNRGEEVIRKARVSGYHSLSAKEQEELFTSVK